jgi:Fic family protein
MTTIYRMEPMLPDDGKHELSNRCVELVSLASGLAGRVHPTLRASIGDLVRSMNCYYSNLIEGHDTHPISIDRALAGDYSKDPEQRNLQLEARAHIEVQRMIDHGEAPEPVVSRAFLQWVHYEFCRRMPEELLIAGEDRDGKPVKVIPGEFRRQLVKVGRHIPIDADDVPAFLARFEQAYDPSRLSKVEAITAAAAAHHRLLWIHPFLDGNGRVARLFSHALLRHLGVGSELWSVSRGLARSKETYKQLLMAADADRRGDLDGRGHLTMAGLQEFCAYFLDQGSWSLGSCCGAWKSGPRRKPEPSACPKDPGNCCAKPLLAAHSRAGAQRRSPAMKNARHGQFWALSSTSAFWSRLVRERPCGLASPRPSLSVGCRCFIRPCRHAKQINTYR